MVSNLPDGSRWGFPPSFGPTGVIAENLRAADNGSQLLTVVDLADGGVVHDADDGVVEMPRPLVADGSVVGLVPGCSAW